MLEKEDDVLGKTVSMYKPTHCLSSDKLLSPLEVFYDSIIRVYV